MTLEPIGELLQRARADAATRQEPGSERDRLLTLAAEFESMLMLQMLKEMRTAGSWDDEDTKDGLGAQTMLETIDVELASHLSRVQGLGLGRQLLESLGAGATGGSTNAGGSTDAGGSTQQDPPYGESGRVLPLGPGGSIPSGNVTSGFGWRADPFHGAARFHRGIDIRAAYGEDIPSAGAGRVITAGIEGGYGQTVVIEHASGLRTRYAHLSATLVNAGDEVGEGQIVGRAGRSGRATGTHLHFEVTTAAGDPLDPGRLSGI